MSLCQRLSSQDMKYCKTQSVQLINETFLDTPGEYLNGCGCAGHLSVTAADAQLILFVQEAAAEDCMFPPGYASSFPKPLGRSCLQMRIWPMRNRRRGQKISEDGRGRRNLCYQCEGRPGP